MNFTDKFLLICAAIFAVHFIIISILAIHQTKHDKQLSLLEKDSPKYWRVPEGQLMLISAIGGSFAMYWAMKKYRHKTKHIKFMLGIPLMMVLQTALLIFILWLKFFWQG